MAPLPTGEPMRRRHALSLLATSLALSSTFTLPAWAAPTTESQRFHQWLDAQWELVLQRQPILATSLGDPRYNDRLIDTTTAAYRAQARRELQGQLKALAGFDKAKLEPKDRVSYSMLKLDLEQNLAGERFPEWMQPISQIGGLPNFLAQMGTGQSIQPFKTTKDYDDWLKRLAKSPPIFDGTIANMRAGLQAGVTQPRAVMDKVLPQLRPWRSPTRRKACSGGRSRTSPTPCRRPIGSASRRACASCCRPACCPPTAGCWPSCATSTRPRRAPARPGRPCPTARPGTPTACGSRRRCRCRPTRSTRSA
jgi:hypothetical protein